jgi:uncharacterized transporter YbjL
VGRRKGGEGQAWQQYQLRAYRIAEQWPDVDLTVGEAEARAPEGTRLFVERIRRGGTIQDAKLDYVLQAGDVVAIAGRREKWWRRWDHGASRSTILRCWRCRPKASMFV